MGQFEGKVVLVTGGGGGIGFGVCSAFVKQGAKVVLTDIVAAPLDIAKEKLEAMGGDVLPIVCDGGVQTQVQDAVSKAVEKYGKIDALVNVAQAAIPGVLLQDVDTQKLDLAIHTGIYATFYFMNACYPYLKESKGSVVNFGSGAGLNGMIGQTAYAAAKEGIRGMSRVAAREWAPLNINVNVVCPFAATPAMIAWKEQYPDQYEATIEQIPMKRAGDPELDIGRLCVFLCSEESKYITGQTISSDGGGDIRP